MEALEAIFTRRSTRKFKPEAPERELIEKVIEAGRCAPSGHNSQFTHYLVITDKGQMETLAGLVQAAFAKFVLLSMNEEKVEASEFAT